MKNEKDLLSNEKSKSNETNDMLTSITDNTISQNFHKLEEKIINTFNNKITTTKFWENEKDFFRELKISRKGFIEWIKDNNYMVKGDNDKYVATEWCEKNGYAINQKNITILLDPVLMNNNSLGYIPTSFISSYCGYYTEKGIEHIKNELKKEKGSVKDERE